MITFIKGVSELIYIWCTQFSSVQQAKIKIKIKAKINGVNVKTLIDHGWNLQFKDGIVDRKDASAVAAGFRDSTDGQQLSHPSLGVGKWVVIHI